jgi:hypothetical protein
MNLTTRQREEVRICSLADCEEIFSGAMSGDRTMVPFLAIGLFSGLRPENELQNLLWSGVEKTNGTNLNPVTYTERGDYCHSHPSSMKRESGFATKGRLKMTPTTRVILMAAFGLLMSATAEAQQTEGKHEEAVQAEIKRVEAMMRDVRERENDLKLHRATPREIMEFCQQTLPKLDDAFRVVMMYAPPEQKPDIQRSYIEMRQRFLNNLIQAQLALSAPSTNSSK